MLHVLAQADAPGVWTHRDIKLGSKQEHREYFIDTTQTTRIELAKLHRSGLQKLLEHHAVVAVFASRHLHRSTGLSNCRMTQYIIRAGWFFDPVRIKLCL